MQLSVWVELEKCTENKRRSEATDKESRTTDCSDDYCASAGDLTGYEPVNTRLLYSAPSDTIKLLTIRD